MKQRVQARLLWLGLSGLLAVGLIVALIFGIRAWQAGQQTPADLFIQSVVQRDANLGWHQLCPTLQQQVSLPDLITQVQRQHSADTQLNITLSAEYIGNHSRAQGGEVRVYLVSAHRPNGWIAQRTYVILTQKNGCVEDISTA